MRGIRGIVDVFFEFEEGLKDIEGFFYVILIYYFYRVRFKSFLVRLYMDENYYGVFVMRVFVCLNFIGILIVRFVERCGNVLIVEDVDVLDGIFFLDIKFYVLEFDYREGVRIGWFEENVYKFLEVKDDGRFVK